MSQVSKIEPIRFAGVEQGNFGCSLGLIWSLYSHKTPAAKDPNVYKPPFRLYKSDPQYPGGYVEYYDFTQTPKVPHPMIAVTASYQEGEGPEGPAPPTGSVHGVAKSNLLVESLESVGMRKIAGFPSCHKGDRSYEKYRQEAMIYLWASEPITNNPLVDRIHQLEKELAEARTLLSAT